MSRKKQTVKHEKIGQCPTCDCTIYEEDENRIGEFICRECGEATTREEIEKWWEE